MRSLIRRTVGPGLTPLLMPRPNRGRWRWAALADVVDLRLSSVDKKTVPGERAVRLCNYSDVSGNAACVSLKLPLDAVVAHGLRRDDINRVRIPLPPIAEQRKIAAILSSIDSTIETTQAVGDQVQVVKRGVMNDLFARGLPGCHTRFKNTEIGEVPAGWMAMTLADAATVVGGGTPRRSQQAFWTGDVLWATPTDVTGLNGRIIGETAASITDAGLTSSSATLLPPSSLLMTTRATIGACAINRVPMATNQGIQNLVPRQQIACVDFLYYLIQYHARRLKQLAAGSTFLEVSRRTVRGFRVYLPPLSEQRKIAEILSSMDDEIGTYLRSLHSLQIVKTGMTSVLLTGELRVTPDTEQT